MFIAIQHQIYNPEKFRERAKEVFPLPDELHVHHFFPSPDLTSAVCLYEAPSVEVLRKYLDNKLKDASNQNYFPVFTKQAIGLPESAKQLS